MVNGRRWLNPLALGLAAGLGFVGAPLVAQAKDASDPASGFVDPRRRTPPRMHRFRLGFEVDYIRLSEAVRDGESQRFHYVPLQIDVAYQLQFLKWAMIRPSFAMGFNVANTLEAMPIMLHPQIYTGYQGSILGVAFGYGFFEPLITTKDALSNIRGGLGQPVISQNHHIAGEISATTRIHRGALSLQLRMGGVTSRTRHYDLNKRRWRFMLMFNAGWYFGDGKKQKQRRERREQRKTAALVLNRSAS